MVWVRASVVGVAASLALMGAGCSSSTEAGGVNTERTPSEAAVAAEVRQDPGARVDAFSAHLTDHLADHIQSAAGGAGFEEALGELKDKLHAAELLATVYTGTAKGAFARSGALTPAGVRLQATLAGAGAEALDPKDYHADQIAALMAELGGQAGDKAPQQAPAPTDAQRQAMIKALEGVGAGASADIAEEAMLKALLAGAAGTPVGQWLDASREGVAALSGKTRQLELLLADGALRYALDVRHGNAHRFSAEIRADKGKLAEAVAAAQREFLAALRAAARGESPEAEVGAMLEALRPADPQYARHIEALARYRAIVEAGGWPTKMPRIPEPKPKDEFQYKAGFKRYPPDVIKLVKARLIGEGLYKGPLDNDWDDALTDAVKRYRDNNQLRDKAWIDYEMVRALEVPAKFRMHQLELNLERMRQSRVHNADYYVRVNLPEFYGELWDKGAQVRRFKVIIGSRGKYRDRRSGQFRFPDETPEMTERMERVVLSPSWSVPPRIRAELKRQADKDPEFYKKHGYEVIPMGGGEMIRQKPGPNNALGLVKFLFPNNDDIYMHDTPRRDLFWHTVRAFSHGCMRVEDPVELAEYILTRQDPELTPRVIRIKSRSGIETPIDLKDGPMVFVEYVTTKVNDDGTVQFFWDVYHKDKGLIAERHKLELPHNAFYP